MDAFDRAIQDQIQRAVDYIMEQENAKRLRMRKALGRIVKLAEDDGLRLVESRASGAAFADLVVQILDEALDGLALVDLNREAVKAKVEADKKIPVPRVLLPDPA